MSSTVTQPRSVMSQHCYHHHVLNGTPRVGWHWVLRVTLRADTSRKPKDSEKDGHGYHFVSRGEMEADIKAGHYLEHGEYEGNLYGTKIDSIRAVVNAGKMCILDVNPQVGST